MFDLLHNTYGGNHNPTHAPHFDTPNNFFSTETRLVLQGYTAQDLEDNLSTKKGKNDYSYQYSEGLKNVVRCCLQWNARDRPELEELRDEINRLKEDIENMSDKVTVAIAAETEDLAVGEVWGTKRKRVIEEVVEEQSEAAETHDFRPYLFKMPKNLLGAGLKSPIVAREQFRGLRALGDAQGRQSGGLFGIGEESPAIRKVETGGLRDFDPSRCLDQDGSPGVGINYAYHDILMMRIIQAEKQMDKATSVLWK